MKAPVLGPGCQGVSWLVLKWGLRQRRGQCKRADGWVVDG